MIGMLSESSLGTMGSFAVDILIKATLLGLVALLAHAALGRKRVLARSMLWNATLAGWLLLPATAALFPHLRIACLPGSDAPDSRASAQAQTPASELPVGDPVPQAEARPAALPDLTLANASPALKRAALPPAKARTSDLITLVLAVYAAVALALVLRLGIALAAIRRLRSSSRSIEFAPWTESLARWCGRLGIRINVGLATSGQVGVPIVVGWWRPLIVVPESLLGRPPGREIDAVLVHELAHVRRNDFVWNCVLRLVQALYWPHPLVWLSGRIMRGVREEVCDDLCVHWMGDASAYRTTLLELASGLLPRPAQSLGMAMTRSTHLGRRLARLERSRGAPRCLPRWPARTAAIALVAAGVSLLGPARLAQTSAQVAGQAEARSKPDQDKPSPEPVTPPRQEGSGQTKPEASSSANQAGKEELPRPEVEAMVVKPRTLQRTTVQPCSLVPANQVAIEPRVSGTISEVLVDIGDRVKTGQVLARLEDAEARAALAKAEIQLRASELKQRQARAAVAVAQATVKGSDAQVEEARSDITRAEAELAYRQKETDRLMMLVNQKSIDARLADEAQARLEGAKSSLAVAQARLRSSEAALLRDRAEVERAQAGLASTELDIAASKNELEFARSRHNAANIAAPINGIVSQRNAQVGSYARSPTDTRNSGGPLFTIMQTDPIRAVVKVPDSDIPFVNVGDPVRVAIANRAMPEIEAKISRLAYSVDPATRTLAAEVDLPNPEGRLRPGQYATATMVLQELKNVLAIPAQACVPSVNPGERRSVECFLIRDGEVTRVRIEAEDPKGIGGWVVVHSGLKEGDVVITKAGLIFGGRPRGTGYGPIAEGQRVEAHIVNP